MEQRPDKKQKTVKTFTRLALPVLACAVMFYTSCRKTENAPAPVNKTGQNTKTSSTPPSNSDISKAVAVNIAKSVGGAFGGVNLMGNIDSLSLAGHMGPHQGNPNSLLCGLFTDSLVSYDTMYGDTTSHRGGNVTFYVNCNNGKLTGYTAYDSTGTTQHAPNGFYQQFYVKQAYTIKCIEDKHLLIDVNGDNYFYQNMHLTCDCGKSVDVIQNANYVLKDLVIDVCNRDILSGMATFTAYGEGWHVTGSIVFVGHHTANVTIGDDTFQINTLNYIY